MSEKIGQSNILLENIINSIINVKGKEVISLDLRKIDSAICKYFVICTGTSNTHVNSIEDNIKKIILKVIGEKPFNIEGNNIGEWVLMDYGDIMVHIFQKKTREYFNIEDFWGDAYFKRYN